MAAACMNDVDDQQEDAAAVTIDQMLHCDLAWASVDEFVNQ
jgi:hypothetical protein